MEQQLVLRTFSPSPIPHNRKAQIPKPLGLLVYLFIQLVHLCSGFMGIAKALAQCIIGAEALHHGVEMSGTMGTADQKGALLFEELDVFSHGEMIAQMGRFVKSLNSSASPITNECTPLDPPHNGTFRGQCSIQ